jgi:regulator of replication initiation timing
MDMPIEMDQGLVDSLYAQLHELSSDMEALLAENQLLNSLLPKGPSVRGLIDAIKKQAEEIEVLRERNAGLMEEKNAAIRAARFSNRKLPK